MHSSASSFKRKQTAHITTGTCKVNVTRNFVHLQSDIHDEEHNDIVTRSTATAQKA